MPKATKPKGPLVDTWGRRNRTLPDYLCETCGAPFHPHRASGRFCSRSCLWSRTGGRTKRTDGGWYVNAKGYIQGHVWIDGKRRAKRQHRWIMEQHLGRSLTASEDVHHINGVKTDNRLENLRLMSKSDHSHHHNPRRKP